MSRKLFALLQPGVQEAGSPRAPTAFRLVRYFVLASLGAFVLVAATLVWHEHRQGLFFNAVQEGQSNFIMRVQEDFSRQQEEVARRDLLAVHESGNVNLTRLFANALWERDFAPFAAKAAQVPIDQCRAMADATDSTGKAVTPSQKKACYAEVGKRIMALPGFRELDARVYDAMKKSTVFKVKVFDLRGITVYSSEHPQIGEDKAANAGWKQAARGTPASELTHRNMFSAFEGMVENRDLISSYLPVLEPGGDRIVGVFEIYSDVTPFLARIRDTATQIRKVAADNQLKVETNALSNRHETARLATVGLVLIAVLMLLLFGVLYLIVRRAESILTQQRRERAQVEQRLAQSEKMASLGQMVAGVTHQLNTPLAFSHSNVSLVLEQLAAIEWPLRLASSLTEAVKRTPGNRVVLNLGRSRAQIERCEPRPQDVRAMREMLGDVLDGIDQMSQLVTHMRDFTRLDRAKTAEVDINRCLHTVVYIASSVIPSRVRVVEEYGALPQVLCSPSQLNQVFLNLVSNAAQAIEGSGTVKVRTAVQGERIRIDVEDSGSGIAPHVLPHIFETYYTTKPEGVGTGLGLSIARDIARAHGGDIEVVTERGRGSTFTVWLPLQHAPELGLAA